MISHPSLTNLVNFNLSIGGLPFFCQNSYSVLISLEGVIQEPVKSYTINENQITFAAAPNTNDAFYAVVLSTTLQLFIYKFDDWNKNCCGND